MTERYIKSEPYAWPYNGDLHPENTALDHHRYADRLLRRRRLCRQDGLRPLADPRADRTDQTGARDDARARLPHHSHPRRPPARPHRPTRQQALAIAPDRRRHRRSRPVRPHPGARRTRLGDHSRSRAAPGRTDHRQARQGLVLRHRSRVDTAATRHREHRANRDNHRCMRPHHDARGQRPRLRMRADGGLLRRDRQEQPRPRAEDDQDAGRRVRRGRDVRRRSSERCRDHRRNAATDRGALGLEAVAHDQAVRRFHRARQRRTQGAAGLVPRAARRKRRRQEHAREMHHGLLPRRPRATSWSTATNRRSPIPRTRTRSGSAWSTSTSRWCRR